MWSAGVILYALLAGALPFRQDTAHCERYRRFSDCILRRRRSPSQLRALSEDMTEHGITFGYASDADDSEFGGSPNKSATLSPFAVQRTLRSIFRGSPSPESKSEAAVTASTDDDLNWFFPEHITASARTLICSLLHPEPSQRPTAAEAKLFAWCQETEDRELSPRIPGNRNEEEEEEEEHQCTDRTISASVDNVELQGLSISLQTEGFDKNSDLFIDTAAALPPNSRGTGSGRTSSRSPPQSPSSVEAKGNGANNTVSRTTRNV